MNKPSNSSHRLAYSLVYAFFKCVAILPLRVLYLFSDLAFFLVYYIARYRRKVVRRNLTACFPEKDSAEIKKTERKFYRNFTDYVFETIKLLHISDAEIKKRMTFGNVEAMDSLMAEGRSIVVYFSHTGNWEWAPSIRLHSRFGNSPTAVFGQIYRPLTSSVFDMLMLKIRSRFGTESIPKALSLRKLLTYLREKRTFAVGFMSDQKPRHYEPVKIVDFFGRPTTAVTGTETLARRLDTAAVYWKMTKPKRGHYHIEVIPMTSNAAQTAPDSLTARYFLLLEENIRQQPEIWLWTHKRWKSSPRSWADVNPETVIRTGSKI